MMLKSIANIQKILNRTDILRLITLLVTYGESEFDSFGIYINFVTRLGLIGITNET